MHEADLKHSEEALQEKLEKIFQLRRTRSKVNWDRSQFLDLLKSFGNPHLDLPPVIHVAGTNGKGSVIALLRAVLEAQGLRVHSYTSPHLVHVNERIYLAGQHIDNAYLHELIDEALSYNQDAPLSFFEITTVLAFKAFSKVPADVLLLEVGMGGELDCTNVIEAPIATIINRISCDHTEFLGDDMAGIARAKAGIMKASVPCIAAYQGQDEHTNVIQSVLRDHAKGVGAELYQYGEEWRLNTEDCVVQIDKGQSSLAFSKPALVGEHQVYNAGLVRMCLHVLRDIIPVSDDAIRQGFERVRWDGRLQCLETDKFGSNTELWLDSGHNDSAAEALSSQIRVWQGQGCNVHVVLGMVGTKDARNFLKPILPCVGDLHIVPIAKEPTSKTVESMEDVVCDLACDVRLHGYDHVMHAVECLSADVDSSSCADKSIILVVGSVYLVGEVIEAVQACD